MAKKVVAGLRDKNAKGFTKVIKAVKSEKTGAYTFREEMVPSDQANDVVKG